MARPEDPFDELDRVFGLYGSRWPRGAMMPMDAFETDGVFTLRFDLPGADPDAVDVTVDNGILTVTASRPREDTEDVNWLIRERPTGQHSRQVRLGAMLDTSSVEARYDQGVLTVTIPVRPEAKPRRVAVETGGRSSIEG